MRYKAHMTIDRDIEVVFESNLTGKKRPYVALQKAAIEAGIEQGLIDIEKDGVSIPWVENVDSLDDAE